MTIPKISLKCILKRKVFVLFVKALSPHSNKWVNASSFIDRRFGLTILTFCGRDCLSLLKFEQWRRLANPENYDEIYVHANDLSQRTAW